MARVGVPFLEPSGLPDAVQKAGGEPVPLRLPLARPAGGVALTREWVADAAEVACASEGLDALLLSADHPEDLAGLLLASIRLDLPAVVARPPEDPFALSLAALGLLPLSRNPPEVVVEVARSGESRAADLIESFPLANALRAGLSLGGGPELLVHLVALSREAGVLDFAQMVHVLAPENPAVTSPGSEWFREHGSLGLLASLGEALHDTPTVAGPLKEGLPPAPAESPEDPGPRLVLVQGRSSGTEGVCRVSGDAPEVAGECRVFDSEENAVRAVGKERVQPGSIVVMRSCGPRGGPGLLRLEKLAGALEESGLTEEVSVLTDGVAPEGVRGAWISLFAPEAAEEGIIGRLRDGDPLRFDLRDGAIRTKVRAEVMDQRIPHGQPASTGHGYAARYAASALPALEGAGIAQKLW